MIKRSRVLIAGLLAISATTAAAEAETVYRSVDDKGRPVFTDQPVPAAEPIEVGPINTVPELELRPDEPQQQRMESVSYDEVRLLIPSIVPNGLAPTEVTLQASPPLRPGHRWRLLIDGELVGEQSSNSITVPQLSRGSHTATAEVVNQRGAVVAESDSVEFFVYWPGGGNR